MFISKCWSTKSGINLDAVKMMGKTVKDLAELTKDNDGLGAAKFVVFCNAVTDNPLWLELSTV